METRSLAATLAAALMLAATDAALAQARSVRNPPILVDTRTRPAGIFAMTPKATDIPGETQLDLRVAYTDGSIWNPAEARFDQVRLRGYQGSGVDPKAPYVSPTIEVAPGDTVRITLHNKLPADSSCTAQQHASGPHCFNGTNLHSHGLWVNPAGNGDNVLISINPGVSFQYEYKIPPEHPAGTFWYHSHRHGSTALQVSSGMAGAFIVRGARAPTADGPGDVDVLLKPTPAQPFRERVLMLQQIQYGCRDAAGKVKKDQAGIYRCAPGDTGTIEDYDEFPPGNWRKSGRYTSVNGLVLPTFDGVKAGQVERWRLIHGGVRDTIGLQLRKLRAAAKPPVKLAAAAQDAYVVENCTGGALATHAIAADGLTMSSALATETLVLQPAYRWDALVVFPEPGTYCVLNAPISAAGSVGRAEREHQILGFVTVEPGRNVAGDLAGYLAGELAAAAAVNIAPAVRQAVLDDLKSGLKLTRFVPHPDIADVELTGKQSVTFKIDTSNGEFQVDGKPYDPSRIDRVLTLGGVEEWTLKSDFVSHPFHIHVNPFQIVKILDAGGKDVSAADAQDGTGATLDPQYRGLKGVWKDTLWVKNPGQTSSGQYTIVVRSRYRRYIGDFVLHCHILDHEDQGMMQNVRIALPDGSGAVGSKHH
jgi:FtsP/CotA-like multicopper oxidase with cupredoxin domain